MNILHIGLSCHYTEGMGYQDNILPAINVVDGHKVTYISDTHSYEKGVLVETEEEDRILSSGIRLIRIKYDKVINSYVSKKIQKTKKLESYLKEIEPEIILFHGLVGFELLTVAKYVKKHKIKLYVDSHADFNNSSTTLLAKIVNRVIQGYFIWRALPHIQKILCLSHEVMTYLEKMYNIDRNIMEWYPLGGTLVNFEKKELLHTQLCEKLGISSNTIILSHSGKLSKAKKTAELIRAFNSANHSETVLLIFGHIPEDMKLELDELIKSNSRIIFLGWKNEQEMLELLQGSDIYCQPGSQSASMQIAMCCGCAMMLYPYKAHFVYMKNNGCFVTNEIEICNAIIEMCSDKKILKEMQRESFLFAQEYLDYRKLAARIYE